MTESNILSHSTTTFISRTHVFVRGRTYPFYVVTEIGRWENFQTYHSIALTKKKLNRKCDFTKFNSEWQHTVRARLCELVFESDSYCWPLPYYDTPGVCARTLAFPPRFTVIICPETTYHRFFNQNKRTNETKHRDRVPHLRPRATWIQLRTPVRSRSGSQQGNPEVDTVLFFHLSITKKKKIILTINCKRILKSRLHIRVKHLYDYNRFPPLCGKRKKPLAKHVGTFSNRK